MRRWSGILTGLLALGAAGLLWAWSGGGEAPPTLQPALFSFEQEDLAGFRVKRPDLTLEVREIDGTWRVIGEDWRPSRAMIRRVGYQLHDLRARAIVHEAPEDPAQFGLGPDATRVTLWLRDGTELAFDVGDPNPTGVSWYIRPLPGSAVYVVKKASLDYFGHVVDEFRERRFASVEEDAIRVITAEIDGETRRFERYGARDWWLVAPTRLPIERDVARAMIGRTAALRADAFLDGVDPIAMGLEPPYARVTLGEGDAGVALDVGALIPNSDPPLRAMRLRGESAVLSAREGFLSAFRVPLGEMRRRTLVDVRGDELDALTVEEGPRRAHLIRRESAFVWEDGARCVEADALVAGLLGVRAEAFEDAGPPPEAGLLTPGRRIVLHAANGSRTLNFGAVDGELRWFSEDGDPTGYRVVDGASEAVAALWTAQRAHDAERAGGTP